MKQEIFKALVNDLNLAGIFDIPADSSFNVQELEEQDLLKSLFDNKEISEIINQETFDEHNINNELSELFATFGSGKSPDLAKLDTIETKVQATKQPKAKPQVIDPRQFKNRNNNTMANGQPSTSSLSEQVKLNNEESSIIKNKPNLSAEDIKVENYITIKKTENAKFIIALPYANETSLHSSITETNLLNNILKSINCNYNECSVIFINDNYLNVFKNLNLAEQKLAKYIEKELLELNSEYILSFCQEFLELTNPSNSVLRAAQGKIIDIKSNKKLLANYSLSAMLKTPKYKSSTWFNLLLIKHKWN